MKRHYDLLIFTSKALPRVKRWRRALKSFFVSRPSRVGGHPAVTRSLLAGLQSTADITWRYSDNLLRKRARTIHAMSGSDTVRDAILAKRSGLCERLIVGPNIVVRAYDDGSVLASPEIDIVIVPSDWVKATYEADEPRLVGRIAVWPSGVDTLYWAPSGKSRSKVLIYEKRQPQLAAEAAQALRSAGYEPVTIHYGHYRPEEFKCALDEAIACVVVGQSESQGIAMAEAWSMNVPTFVRRFDFTAEEGIPCSAAPYLTPVTGASWCSCDDLVALINQGVDGYCPREWVLSNCTDRISAEEYLKIALP